tara:strand:- start:899 stop:1414 length:516 start_codon:yes stop_codon:yes gene_type:complete
MTKARTLADFDTTSIPASVITGLPAGGKILQIQYTQNTDVPSHIVTSSTTPVTTGISVDITPSATDSKIQVDFFTGMAAAQTGNDVKFSLYRATTNLTSSAYNWCQFRIEGGTAGTGTNYGTVAATYIDSSHNTSGSALTYTIYFESANGNNVYACQDGGAYLIRATEIAA